MSLLLLNAFLSPVLTSLRWFLLMTCYWCNLITSCCAYSSNDISRSVGDNALVVQSDGWCLVLVLLLLWYPSYHPIHSYPVRDQRFQSFYNTFMYGSYMNLDFCSNFRIIILNFFHGYLLRPLKFWLPQKFWAIKQNMYLFVAWSS